MGAGRQEESLTAAVKTGDEWSDQAVCGVVLDRGQHALGLNQTVGASAGFSLAVFSFISAMAS